MSARAEKRYRRACRDYLRAQLALKESPIEAVRAYCEAIYPDDPQRRAALFVGILERFQGMLAERIQAKEKRQASQRSRPR